MKRNFWVGASFSALVLAAMAPWSASQANGVSVRVNTPEFGIRIGAPYPLPVYHPAPVYVPAPVVYPRAPRYIAPPVVYGYPYHYAGGRVIHIGHHWQHDHWRQDWRHDNHGQQRHWR